MFSLDTFPEWARVEAGAGCAYNIRSPKTPAQNPLFYSFLFLQPVFKTNIITIHNLPVHPYILALIPPSPSCPITSI